MQNRDAPAYQEYAATLLAQLPFRQMTLPERGLCFTMRLECWVNQRLPDSPDALAKVLGLNPDDVSRALPAAMAFFKKQGGFLTCPELDDYRQHLREIREKQSKGGKAGAAMTNAKLARTALDTDALSTTPTSNPQLPRRVTNESLVKPSTAKQSQTQSLEGEVITDQWVSEYECAENAAAQYACTSLKA